MSFDMPAGIGVTFERRGGWVVNALAQRYHLTLEQAAGIVGNLGYESAGFKALQEALPISGRGGYGWAQWTGPRRVAFESWCRQRSLKVSSDEANFGYLCAELDGPYRSCVAAVRIETTIERCVFVWGRDFEAPGGTTQTHLPGFDDRLRYARRALSGAQPAPAPQPAPARDQIVATIKTLQQQLAGLGYYKGLIDGDWGPASQAAMAAFRSAQAAA